MVAFAENFAKGCGLYTPQEAAMYARLSSTTMSRWLYGSQMGERVMLPQLESEKEKVVSFLDFVQALAIHAIRVQHKIPLQKIRDAVSRATEEYKLDYPFARKHRTFLFEKEIYILPDDHLEPVQVSGKAANQMAMRRIVELYMTDLSFDASGLAQDYRAYQWNSFEVRMNPRQRFGEPLVVSCGYTAQTLWEACKNEGGFDAAAVAYGVKPEEVELAFRYYDYLQGNPAA